MAKWGVIVSVVGFGIGILVWPYGLTDPIAHTIHTFKGQSAFAAGIRQLFEGSLQWSDALPWYYTPKFILMTIPVAVIAGLVLFFTFVWKSQKNYFNYFIIFFTFFFPIFWIVYTIANVFGGWRHSLFVYPPMVVAAGLGFNLAIEWLRKKTKKNNLIDVAAIVVILLLLWNPVRHIIKNHPYEYVYFNELTGGVKKVYGNYEMDYYYNSTREAAEWILKNTEIVPCDNSKLRVASWHQASVQYFFRNDTANYRTLFSRWYERGNTDWDYAIFTITGMMPEEIKNPDFPPKNTVYQVKIEGKPICLVLKRETKDDLTGFRLKNEKEYESAIYYLQKALEIDPTNVSVLINLIECYFNTRQFDLAKIYIDQLLGYVPKSEPANYFLAHYYNFVGEPDKTLRVLKSIRESNKNFKAAYHFAFQLYAKQNDLKNAEKMMLELLAVNQLDEQGFNQLISVYKSQNLDERGAYKKIYKKHIDAFEKLGMKKEAQMYRDALKGMR
jgi:tetratricopeptide (TPR) repeat protein